MKSLLTVLNEALVKREGYETGTMICDGWYAIECLENNFRKVTKMIKELLSPGQCFFFGWTGSNLYYEDPKQSEAENQFRREEMEKNRYDSHELSVYSVSADGFDEYMAFPGRSLELVKHYDNSSAGWKEFARAVTYSGYCKIFKIVDKSDVVGMTGKEIESQRQSMIGQYDLDATYKQTTKRRKKTTTRKRSV